MSIASAWHRATNSSSSWSERMLPIAGRYATRLSPYGVVCASSSMKPRSRRSSSAMSAARSPFRRSSFRTSSSIRLLPPGGAREISL
jgi:hypothetical protein